MSSAEGDDGEKLLPWYDYDVVVDMPVSSEVVIGNFQLRRDLIKFRETFKETSNNCLEISKRLTRGN